MIFIIIGVLAYVLVGLILAFAVLSSLPYLNISVGEIILFILIWPYWLIREVLGR